MTEDAGVSEFLWLTSFVICSIQTSHCLPVPLSFTWIHRNLMTQRSLQLVLVVNSLPEHPCATLHACAPQYCAQWPCPKEIQSKSCMAEQSWSVRGDRKCGSCQHSVLHQVEALTSAAHRFTLVKFIRFKCTGLSAFFLFKARKWGYCGQLRYLVDAAVGFAVPINFPK